MTVLPTSESPKILHSSAARATESDAWLVVLPPDAGRDRFALLPESERWQELNARSAPRSGTVRSTVLANRRQTLAVLGYLRADASHFERLALAGRMLKECAPREAQSLALAALGGAERAASLDALLAASLANSFALPSFRSHKRDERRIKTIFHCGRRRGGRPLRGGGRPKPIIWLVGSPLCPRTCSTLAAITVRLPNWPGSTA